VSQSFRYLISSDQDRWLLIDCLSFAPHKRHLVLCSLANLLPDNPPDLSDIDGRDTAAKGTPAGALPR
jgi:hypothetical protein